jgi:hypothetical protein
MNRALFEGLEPEAGSPEGSGGIAGIPKDVIEAAVRRGVVSPERRTDKDWFSPRDIAKMKLIHAMVMQARVQSALVDCYRAAKARAGREPPRMRSPVVDNDLGDCARELIMAAKP